MSRIGKMPIILPTGVDVKADAGFLVVKGPKGELTAPLHPHVSIALKEVEGKRTLEFYVDNPADTSDRALWGTTQSIAANMVEGVERPFSKQLEVEGVGFRVTISGKKLVLSLGFSHDVEFEIPAGLEATVEKNVITLRGADKQLVGQIAAQIRKLRKPEPYKGKGVHYV